MNLQLFIFNFQANIIFSKFYITFAMDRMIFFKPMLEYWYIIILVFFLLYSLGVLAVVGVWYFTPSFDVKQESVQHYISFSILIPIRNESKNLPSLWSSLQALDYPKNCFEIFFIDDHSEDDSLSFLKQLKQENVKLLFNKGEGKKAAITTALSVAKGDYIVQTDADCCVDALWLQTINAFIQKERQDREVHLIAAPVLISDKPTFLNHFQSIDFVGLQMVTLGMMGLKCPTMLNGANLIYNKNSWQLLQEKLLISGQETPSGDDTFLLYAVKKEWGTRGIFYLKSLGALVRTQAVESVSDFWQQRIRWASKTKYVKDADTIVAGIVVAGLHFSILCLMLMTLIDSSFGCALLLSFLGKLLLDGWLFYPYARYFKKKNLLYYLPFFTFISYFYVLGVIIFSSFASFKWKSRNYTLK